MRAALDTVMLWLMAYPWAGALAVPVVVALALALPSGSARRRGGSEP